MIDALWTGWRSQYLKEVVERGDETSTEVESVFSQILCSNISDEAAYIVHRGGLVFVILNAFPYAVGHLLVLPYRQISDLSSLSDSESLELWATVTRASEVLNTVYEPQGLNIGINIGRPAGGSVADHLHVHIVPRNIGDANFMAVTANAKTISEPLNVTAQRIRQCWLEQVLP
ncbi:MAG: HIT domain-containing protein [Actinomycetes bacterium]